MNDIDLFFIRFMAGWIGIALCFILSALYKRITVKRKKDELELKQREEMFGDCGTSPRSGWITDEKGFDEFMSELLNRLSD